MTSHELASRNTVKKVIYAGGKIHVFWRQTIRVRQMSYTKTAPLQWNISFIHPIISKC